MARLGRYLLPGVPQHLIQRGNNRQPIFFTAGDRRLFQAWLAEAAARHRVAVHAYVLMANHVHLLATPATPDGLSRMMQSLGRRYVRHVNAARRRTGTLWEGRYRAAPIEAARHLLACCRYIELNPVRAGLVARADAYPWSSHRAHAQGAADPVVGLHPLYLALGKTPAARQAAYRRLFRSAPAAAFVAALRAATNGGWALGGEDFRLGLERALGRRAAPLPKGRPREQEEAG